MKIVFLSIFTASVLILNGCMADSSNDNIPETSTKNAINQTIQGQWQSEQFVEDGMLVTYSWTFEGTSFLRTVTAQSSSVGLSIAQTNGTYTSPDGVVVSSGVTAQTINLTYTDSSENEFTVMDIVYIKNDELYFGQENINETCESEFYEKTNLEVEIVNGQIRGFEETSQCYSRPVDLDYERVYRSVQ